MDIERNYVNRPSIRKVDGEEVRLMLWDTAGQEEFDAITKAYYRGAQACVLAFSTTDRDSFEAAHSWKLKVENECGEIPTVIVQNKIDLIDQTLVNPEEAELLARALGCRLLRTSVKEDINVASVFRHLAARCLAELRDTRDDYYSTPNGHPPVTIIGAPKAFGNNRDLIRPGAVYKCNIGTHEPCEEYVIEYEGNTKKVGIYIEKKDGGLLGASLDGGENAGDTFFACSPKWKMEVQSRMGQAYLTNGICYAIQNSLNVNDTGDRMMPLSNTGSVYRGKILNGYTLAPQPRLSKNQGIKLDGRLPNPLHISALKSGICYLGYSVSSGKFTPRSSNLWYITGSPRAEFLHGMVLLFEYRTHDDDDLIVHEKLVGEQVGSYFGSSVLGVSTSNDGLDDLLAVCIVEKKKKKKKKKKFLNGYTLAPQPRLSKNQGIKLDGRLPNPLHISALKSGICYLGYSVSSGKFTPRSSNLWYITGSPRAEFLHGMVLLFEYRTHDDDDLIVHEKLVGEQVGSYFGSSVLGVSTSNDGLDDLLVGSVYRGKILNGYTLAPQPRLSKNQGIKLDGRLPNPLHISALKSGICYLGYSVSSGKFTPRSSNLWYITGSPRAEFLHGMVLLFEYRTHDDDDLIVHEKLVGEQVGSYFGSSVLGVSTSNDGLDDLLVGAPTYKVDTWDEGCVYFYKNTGQGSFSAPKKLLGSKIMGARFGTTMTSIGDLNQDLYNDVAISAPYEDESGVVYVYLGSSYGLNTMYSQKILGRKISNSIRGFGFSLSKGLDIDQNLYNVLSVCSLGDSFNFDLDFVDVVSGDSSDNYFGYSVLLQKGDPSSVIVGAPKSSSIFESHRDLVRPGAIYKCNIGISEACQEYVVEDQGNTEKFYSNFYTYKDKKDDGLLGASLDGGENVGDVIFTCSPRWKNDRVDRSGQHYLANGICYTIKNSLRVNETGDRLMPLLNTGKQGYSFNRVVKYYYAMGELGFSMHYIKDNKELLLGTPGLLGWRGSVYNGKILDEDTSPPFQRLSQRPIREIKVNSRLPNPVYIAALEDDNSYLGYSVSSGKFVRQYRDLWYIAGSPRAEFLHGLVLLFEYPSHDDADLIVHDKFVGEQIGSYFGSSVLGISTTSDGLDDLLVGAPSYVVDTWDEGCIFFYKNTGQRSFSSPKKIFGSKTAGARFGTTMTSIGDLNKDSYNDVAISAPYEEESGVVYIYLGSSHGLNTEYSQRIVGRSVKNSIRGFGFSLSKGLDIDKNLYNDLAIGAYKSGEVVIVKSRPVIKYVAHFKTSIKELLVHTSEFHIDYCLQYRSPAKNIQKVETDVEIILDSRAVDNKVIYKTIILEQNSTLCEKLNISLQKGHFDYSNAFTIKLNYGISKNKQQNFCALCPVIDPKDTNSTTFEIPFANGCGDDNICTPDLKITVTADTDQISLIIGQLTTLSLKATITNMGEPAYLSQVFLTLPQDVEIQRISSRCEFGDDGVYGCVFSDVLQPNASKDVVFDLDLKNSNPLDLRLEFILSVTSRGNELNEKDNNVTIQIPLRLENSIEISGISYPDSIIFVNETNQITFETATFNHEYIVKNLGPSPMPNVPAIFYFPVEIDTAKGKQVILDVYEPQAFVSNQAVKCLTNYRLGFRPFEVEGGDSETVNDNDQSKPRLLRSADFTNDNSTELSFGDLDLPENRTLPVNCKSESVKCMKIVCPVLRILNKNEFISVKFTVKAHIDVLSKSFYELETPELLFFILAQVTYQKDIILLSSTAESSSYTKTILYHVPTVLIGSITKTELSYWIYIGCVVAALLILGILILVLYKLHFFSRPIRERLNNVTDSSTEEKALKEDSLNEENT
ncbi:hypothetical protein FQA39_LY03494 [Lamprigera yunnana]|nr:hypothetical protein FQA39_LY03494 [Lamprigera yunnana]